MLPLAPERCLNPAVPRVMGVLNVTPDSFSDGGLHMAHEQAVEHALGMLADGAWCIDVGGESTRPGARPVGTAEELERVIGVVELLRSETPAVISVDTSKPEVMLAAARAGADLLNDVRALTLPGAMEAAASLGLPVCLMHMQGRPATMQAAPGYADVVSEVRDFLLQRIAACSKAGIPRANLIIDPGFGFGKTLRHNQQLLRHLDVFVGTGLPVLVGLSRKSLIPAVMAGHWSAWEDRGARSRTGGSIALALYAARKGAHIVRVHEVRETVEALTMWADLAGD